MSDGHKLLIGLSPRLLRDAADLGFGTKTLQYLEQSVPHWVMSLGQMLVMLPTIERSYPGRHATVAIEDYVDALDGLLLQGGADIDPACYGEARTHARGRIDAVRDRFEIDLLRAFSAAGKPVFGICRGMQLINVAFGGTLYQDLHLDAVTSDAHHVIDRYDEHMHRVRIDPGSWMAGVYGGVSEGIVNSIHHQGIKQLGTGLVAEAHADDGVVEALRWQGDGFVVGVQWHPEFHDHRYPDLLPADPLMHAFFEAARRRRDAGRGATAVSRPTARAGGAGLR
jgi:putative glutamine amidotransferase